MDLSRLAQDVLAFAGQEGCLSGNLAEMENKLRELMQRIGQASFQTYCDQDKARGYEGSSRACRCGKSQKFVSHRARTIQTHFGPLTLRRAYYHCKDCGCGHFPFDCDQGLGVHAVSVALAESAVELAETMAFRPSSEKLQRLIGVSLSANTINRLARQVGQVAASAEEQAAQQVKTNRHDLPARTAGRLYNFVDGAMVHRTDGWHEVKALQCRWQDSAGRWHSRHLCRNEDAEGFTSLAWATMHACGLDNARQNILCGDGIPWIWNHLGPIADGAVEILDWYHAKEHLWKLAKALYGEGSQRCQTFAESLETLLWESKSQDLLAVLKREHSRLRSVSKRAAIDELAGYLRRHLARIDYRKYRDEGLLIGSGPIEGDCKNLIHARMKRGSPRWSKEGCQSMLSLRCCYANEGQKALWNRKPLLAA
jgi:hypothetical protein